MRSDIQIIDLPALHDPIQEELDSAITGVMKDQQFINGREVGSFDNELGSYLSA